MKRSIAPITLCLVGACLLTSHAFAVEVDVRLLSEVEEVVPGRPFWTAIELRMHEGWHTYFINPGDAGFGTSIEWNLPEGWTTDSIAWPTPKTFGEPPEVTYGYDGVALLLVRVHPPASINTDSVTLKGSVSWLACKGMCVPGDGDVERTLHVARANSPTTSTTEEAQRVSEAVASLPGNLPEGATVSVGSSASNKSLTLRVTGLSRNSLAGPFDLFAVVEGLFDLSEMPAVEKLSDGFAVTYKLAVKPDALPQRLVGIVAHGSGTGREGWAINTKITRR